MDPTSAPLDTALDVHVFGDYFDSGSKVALKRGGRATRKVVTNSTTFVSAQELVANITIAFDADTGAYDVEVMTLDGRRGVGTEMFYVRLPNNMSMATLEFSDWTATLWSPVGAFQATAFTTDGRLLINTAGQRKQKALPGIELCLDLSHLAGDGIVDQALYDLFVQQVAKDATSAGLSGVCSLVTMHTRDHSNPEQMSNQAVGTIEHAGGKIVLKDFDTGVGGNGGWEWRLIWDGPGANMVEPPTPDLGQGVCISRPDLLTWYVYNDDGSPGDPLGSCVAHDVAVDNIAELWRVTGEGFSRVAEFAVPFRFRVTVVKLPGQ